MNEPDFQRFLQNIQREFSIDSLWNVPFSNENNSLDVLFISGGATRFIGLAAASIETLNFGYKPDIIGGISSGALLSLPLVLGKYDDIINAGKNITKRAIFKIPPTTDKGGLSWRAIFRAIVGEYCFGIQDVPKILRKYISKEEFAFYQASPLPDIFIMAVNGNTGNPKMWNLKDCSIDYEKYLLIVSASCAIPIMTQAIWIDGEPYFDGGMRHHTPSAAILSKYSINKCISIFARPQLFEEFDDKWKNNVIRMIWRTLRVMSISISKADERAEKLLCFAKNIELCQVFLPNVLKDLYSTDKLDELFEQSKIEAKKQLEGFFS